MEAASAGVQTLLSQQAGLACGVVGVVLVSPCVIGEGSRGQASTPSEGAGRQLEMQVDAKGAVRLATPAGQLHVQAGVGAAHKALLKPLVGQGPGARPGWRSLVGSGKGPAAPVC